MSVLMTGPSPADSNCRGTSRDAEAWSALGMESGETNVIRQAATTLETVEDFMSTFAARRKDGPTLLVALQWLRANVESMPDRCLAGVASYRKLRHDA